MSAGVSVSGVVAGYSVWAGGGAVWAGSEVAPGMVGATSWMAPLPQAGWRRMARAIRRGRRTSVVFRALLFMVTAVCSRICLRYDCFTGSGFFVLSIFNSSREPECISGALGWEFGSLLQSLLVQALLADSSHEPGEVIAPAPVAQKPVVCLAVV